MSYIIVPRHTGPPTIGTHSPPLPEGTLIGAGAGLGDTLSNAKAIRLGGRKVLIAFAAQGSGGPNGDHYNGVAHTVLSRDLGRTVDLSTVDLPGNDSGLTENYGTRNFAIGRTSTGVLSCIGLSQIKTSAGTTDGLWYDTASTYNGWSSSWTEFQSGFGSLTGVWVCGGKMIETSNGLMTPLWKPATDEYVSLFLNTSGVPTSLGTIETLDSGSATNPDETTVCAVSTSNLVSASRNSNTQHIGFRTSTDGGDTFTAQGSWQVPDSLVDSSFPDLEIVGSNAIFTFGARTTGGSPGRVFEIIVSASSLHSDPVSTISAASDITVASMSWNSTVYETAYAHCRRLDMPGGKTARLILWHEDASGGTGHNSEIQRIRTIAV